MRRVLVVGISEPITLEQAETAKRSIRAKLGHELEVLVVGGCSSILELELEDERARSAPIEDELDGA